MRLMLAKMFIKISFKTKGNNTKLNIGLPVMISEDLMLEDFAFILSTLPQ